MLSNEYVHNRVKLFRIELRLIVLAILLVVILVWQILRMLMVIK
jgi:hypothetical protein